MGKDETAEHKYFRELDFSGKIVYDVGAFVGLFALQSARTASHVVCYEPLDKTRARLQEHLELNAVKNVQIRPVGVGRERATLQLAFDPLMPGGASLSASISAGIVSGGGSDIRRIEVTTLDLDIVESKLPSPDFIKIDIEGFELDALIGAAETLRKVRPTLYLEMHGETMTEKREKVHAIVVFLAAIGYDSIQHLETGALLTPQNSDLAAEGHLVCTWSRESLTEPLLSA